MKFVSLFFKLFVILPLLHVIDASGGSFTTEFYGKVYPEWRIDRFSDGSPEGSLVGTMGTLKNNSAILSSTASSKENSSDWAWSNSYIGLRNEFSHQTYKVGIDYQLLVDTNGDDSLLRNLNNNLDTRDAYIYLEYQHGKILFGKMDSIYKDWGDKYPMLGISSSNLVSTSRILSNSSWKGNGDRSFHNRRNNTLTYITPKLSGIEIGASYSFNEKSNGPGGPGTKLAAFAIRWSNENWYTALAHEIHYDWLPLSKSEINPSMTSIKNDSRNTSSRDKATRLSLGWKSNIFKIGVDAAKLKYSENSYTDDIGKFMYYKNTTGQFSIELKLIQDFLIAYNFAIGSPGSCKLSGGIHCTTTNLGGYQNSFGAIYYPQNNLGIFFIASEIRNRDSSRYASSPQGSIMNSYATGLNLKF